MTYCVDFFRKFRKEGNFCGLDKSEVSRLNNYMEIVDLLMKQKIPEETVYHNMPLKVARPLLSAKGDTRTTGLNFVSNQLREGKRITSNDLQVTLKTYPSDGNGVKKLDKSNFSDGEVLQKPPSPFQPAPGSIPVTDAPPIQPLSARLKIEELPVLSPDASMEEKLKRDELLLAANGFVPASQLINGGLVTKPAPYKILPEQLSKEAAEEILIKFVRGYLTNKDREALGTIMRHGELGTDYVSIFSGMIWYCHDAMQGE